MKRRSFDEPRRPAVPRRGKGMAMGEDEPQAAIEFGGFTLDLRRGCLRHGADEIALRPKAFRVLHYLAERADRLVPKDKIIGAL
jgi:DNA-binding response OmpR family regulator